MSLEAALTRAMARREAVSASVIKSKAVPAKTLSVFTRQWSALMSAGIPLSQAFELLSQSIVGPRSAQQSFATTLQSLRADIHAGQSLYTAFQKHPQVFNQHYCSLLHAGEVAGILDKILDRLADTLEAHAILKAKLKNALIYPASILVIAVMVLVVILLWVVPVFEDVFKSMGASLPWATQQLIQLSSWMSHWASALTGALLMLAALLRWAHQRSLKFQIISEKMTFATPILGPLIQAAMIVKWAQTLSALLQAGTPLAEALSPASAASGSPNLNQTTRHLIQHIQEGHSLSKAMSKSNLFSTMTIQMCTIGEETGSLDTMLERAAQLMESDVNQQIGNLSTLLEPIIMVVLGTLIGGILLALYLPIFNLGQVF
jgi:type IV pilus assembly protein PilC